MAENTREIILDTLLAIERGEAFSHKLIKAVLDKYDYLEGREKAFIKRVTEGSLERQIELDYYLNHFSSVPVRKMKPLIRCLLRMSTYQLLFMDAIPDSAVCNEACKLAAKRKFHNLKGFVNGVLRNIAKNKDNLPMPDAERDKAEFYSVKYSMPKWLVEYWMDAYGEETTVSLLEGLLKIHPVSLRFRIDLSSEEKESLIAAMEAEGVRLTQSPYLPYVYQLEDVESLSSLPGFDEGVFTVQDVSSALAVEAADIQPGDFVMDICAAPGGKSILAAEKADKVLSRDISQAKTSVIEENIQRMQQDNIAVEVHDATIFDEAYREKADVVIMDVPCSGLGVIGKKRDIKYHVTPESLIDIVALQRQIVENSWQYVKPGGILLYSTCTINPKENEEMVEWIIGKFPFEPEAQKQIFPGIMEADGFFYARLRRKNVE
ncbi:MAG: 16S rRNA (cytosine(967)-C(5))-methyltransferase RsmB [Lachnospiraceae bacterium]|nr:16S rRNA (cytosine(967)-C(5))-methyltransferase RsmB [Lachnospiraceae bacterium]